VADAGIQVLESLTLASVLYEGQQTRLYRGRPLDGASVMVKLLKSAYPSPRELAKLRHEYALLQQLEGVSGVVRALALERYGHGLALVLEAVPGQSLRELLDAGRLFLHDRVQQAAYERVEPSRRPAVHPRLGRLLLQKSGGAPLPEVLFEVVNHLNLDMALVTERSAHPSAQCAPNQRPIISNASRTASMSPAAAAPVICSARAASSVTRRGSGPPSLTPSPQGLGPVPEFSTSRERKPVPLDRSSSRVLGATICGETRGSDHRERRGQGPCPGAGSTAR